MAMGIADKFINSYLKEWWETSAEFPQMDRLFEPSLQKSKERRMDAVVEKLLAEVRMHPENIQAEYLQWGAKVRSLLCIAGDDILELSGGGMRKLFGGGYLEVTSDFIEKTRKFDETTITPDIMQAMRNVWIMNCIQVLFCREVELTPAVFAYSMLYPYTDNYLDSNGVSMESKRSFGERFRVKLSGGNVQAQNPYENKVFSLVEMIEEQYKREKFPVVYESLIGIHDAQQISLNQQEGAFSPYVTDITGISIKKGGSSVLADGYLVNGNMTEEQASFMFAFGVFLQLIDDSQDVGEDKKNSHMTIFSQTAGKWKLDSIMNKLLNFMFNLLDKDECFGAPEMKEQKLLIKSACTLLLIVAVANNSSMYSFKFVKSLEGCSPLRFAYLRRLYKRAGREYLSLFVKNVKNSPQRDIVMVRALAGI